MTCLLVARGLGLPIAGGDLPVRGATGRARRSGLSPLVLELTVAAVGTCLPELVTTVVASLRRQATWPLETCRATTYTSCPASPR